MAGGSSPPPRATARSTPWTPHCESAVAEQFPEFANVELVDYKVRILAGSAGTDSITRVLVSSARGAAGMDHRRRARQRRRGVLAGPGGRAGLRAATRRVRPAPPLFRRRSAHRERCPPAAMAGRPPPAGHRYRRDSVDRSCRAVGLSRIRRGLRRAPPDPGVRIGTSCAGGSPHAPGQDRPPRRGRVRHRSTDRRARNGRGRSPTTRSERRPTPAGPGHWPTPGCSPRSCRPRWSQSAATTPTTPRNSVMRCPARR